ncbi:hypothetical protein D3C73_874720 [compost metagenome]
MLPGNGIEQTKAQRHQAGLPASRTPYFTQLAIVTGAIGMARMCLYRVGETVQRISGEGQQIHQHRIYRDHLAAQPGTEDGQRGKTQLQQQ